MTRFKQLIPLAFLFAAPMLAEFGGLAVGNPEDGTGRFVVGIARNIEGVTIVDGRATLANEFSLLLEAYPAFAEPGDLGSRNVRVTLLNSALTAPAVDLYVEGLGWLNVTPRAASEQDAIAMSDGLGGNFVRQGRANVTVTVEQFGLIRVSVRF